jgi:Membrane-associated lipoprotein involved in thiamine biosynthesis
MKNLGLKSAGIITLLIFCVSCTKKEQYYVEKGSVFHTVYSIKYQAPKPLFDKIEAELRAFDLSMNPFNPNSIISKVNRNEDVEIDEWFTVVFNKAMEVSAISGGAFDVTVAPLINLWGFGPEKTGDISQQAIDSIKEFVGYQKVRIENKRLIKDNPRIKLNFSAIAKGFASDIVAAVLEREGVENYMIEIGGEIATKGKNPNGNCWGIEIPKPKDDPTGMNIERQAIIDLCTKTGMATSGDYRNFYIKDGIKYSHTIDPHTGYPAERTIRSATVIAPDCMTADAYATVFMVMGVEVAEEIAKKVPEIEFYLVYEEDASGNFKTKYSDGMKSMLR